MRRRMLYRLLNLAVVYQHLPSSIYIPGIRIIGDPCRGGFADVYKGVYHGTLVAVKKLRHNQDGTYPFSVCYACLVNVDLLRHLYSDFAERHLCGGSWIILTSFLSLELWLGLPQTSLTTVLYRLGWPTAPSGSSCILISLTLIWTAHAWYVTI
jgi:hypothetical protein